MAESALAENAQAAPEATSTQRAFIDSTCEVVGYAATVAWLPTLLLSGTFADEGAAWAAALPTAVAPLAPALPAAACLALCAVFGLAIMALADRITQPAHFNGLWVAAFCCAVGSLCVPMAAVQLVLLAAAYTVARLLWKLHLVNKAFDMRTLLMATLLCGAFLAASAFFGNLGIGVDVCLLLIISLSLFLALSSTTFKDWVEVPKEAMRERFSLARKLFVMTTKALTGVAFGALLALTGSQLALIVTGVTWALASAVAWGMGKLRTGRASKSSLRGTYLLCATALLALMPALPRWGCVACCVLLTLLTVSNVVHGAIRHMVIKKDATLADVYLCGFRHTTNNGAMAITFLLGYAAFALPAMPREAVLVLFGLLIVAVTFVTLLSIGVFEARRERTPLPAVRDPWHEKVMVMARDHGLSDRQTEIFDMLSRGRNAKYITQRLYLSEGTVKKHIFQIYKEMDVHTQQDLITKVLEVDLTPKTGAE